MPDAELWKRVGLNQVEYARIVKDLKREPNELELHLYGAMWSEHCGYKFSRPLFRFLYTKGERVRQGPGENAGVVDIGHGDLITMKVESHNHPSAISPYQGAATGVGGIIRDILAMGAMPIALLNSLCLADPRTTSAHSKYLIEEVVRGIADYGNCVGVPTVGGEMRFAPGYEENPLVNVMCVGLIREGEVRRAYAGGAGNSVLLVGNSTGRDGIGGASFASRELKDEERSAVQVGDPFVERLLIEAMHEAFKDDFIVGIQDMGAAGIISSTSETAAKAGTGIELEIDRVPLRESGMKPSEIMISESQERMLVIVQKGREEEAEKVFRKWGLHSSVIGRVTDDGNIRIISAGKVVGEVPARSLVHPPSYRKRVKKPTYLKRVAELREESLPVPSDLNRTLLALLGSLNICSKKWVWRQYDHMIQTNTVIPPGTDAAFLRLKGRNKAIALTIDSNSRYVYLNPRRGSAISVAEACRNLIASGARPIAVTDGLNFANPEKEEIYFQLRESILGMSRACRALKVPIISGNASLYNERGGSRIWPTPVIGALGLVEDLGSIITPCFKSEGNAVFLLGKTKNELGASLYLATIHHQVRGAVPDLNLELERRTGEAVLQMIGSGLLRSAHDLSEGGLAVGVAECSILGEIGAEINLKSRIRPDSLFFGESQSRFLISCEQETREKVKEIARQHEVPLEEIGKVKGDRIIFRIGRKPLISLSLEKAVKAYFSALPEALGYQSVDGERG